MSDYKKYVDYKMDNHIDWSLLEGLYFNNYENYNKEKYDVIPKKIHQIWIGGKIPDKFKRLSETWTQFNPDWEYKLWGDEDIEGLNMINKKLYDRAKNVGIKSDILRYEILYKFGGICPDTDFECLKSFNDLIYLNLFTGNGYSTFPHVYCGLIGTIPEHEIFKRVLTELKNKENSKIDIDFNQILHFSGPDFFSKILFGYLNETISNQKNIVVFPRLFFYPMSPGLRHELKNLNDIDKNKAHSFINEKSYAIHYWGCSWQK